MRIRIDQTIFKKNKVKHLQGIIKWLISQAKDLKYKVKCINVYISFIDQNEKTVDEVEGMAPFYEISAQKYPTDSDDYMVGWISEDSYLDNEYDGSAFYVYGHEYVPSFEYIRPKNKSDEFNHYYIDKKKMVYRW